MEADLKAHSRGRIEAAIVALSTIAIACCAAPHPGKPIVPPLTERPAPEMLTGKIVWHDLLTHDSGAARRFYGDLFGWGFEPLEGGDTGRSWNITWDGRAIGSVFEVDPDRVESPLWLLSVSVPDVDEAASRARDLGASTTAAPSDLPDRGRYAVIEDPQGSYLVLLHSSSGDPADAPAFTSGDWLWAELWTTDAAAALVFYTELLGYRSEGLPSRLAEASEEDVRVDETVEGPPVFYSLSSEGRPRAGIHQLPGNTPPHWLPYVAVSDASATAARAEELGGRVLLPPEAVRDGEAAILVDPEGAPFGIQQWPRPGGGDR
ncbi:MAG: VOC family protein [Candidatus Palauibacterales bacterium]|nr:VOC family protein [Candidatus Palauibacterales bacterium]